MVVLAAAVCSKTGKPIVSRQFVELSRSRIEGLLAAFPKLIGGDDQHTFVETESVRYVYQPLEQLYMVIITTKSSNIIEDLDTLHLLARLVPEHCRTLTEEEVTKNIFELVFAFDEVIQLGYREKITLPQVKTFLEMDSHEEKIAEMIEKNKQREAKEEAKRRQTQIEKERSEAAKSGRPFTGFGPSSMGGGGGYPGSGSTASTITEYKPPPPREERAPAEAAGPKKSLVLKKAAAKGDALMKQLEAEGAISAAPVIAPRATAAAEGAAPAAHQESLHVAVDEKLVVVLSSDGQVQNIDVKGELVLTLTDPEKSRVAIKLQPLDHKGVFKFNTHPNLNKTTFTSDSVLVLKDPTKGFPPNLPLGLLKWRYTTKEDEGLPLKVSCWVSPSPKQTTVNVEYELLNTRLNVSNLRVLIPIPGNGAPAVASGEGSTSFSAKTRQLTWTVPLVDANNTGGTMEFTLPYGSDSANFFPVHVHFASPTTICPVTIVDVQPATGGSSVKHSSHKELVVEQYDIVNQ